MWKALVAVTLLWPCLGRAELIPDTTFGSAGTVDIALDGRMYGDPARIAVLPDRRILVARVDGRPDTPPLMPSISFARLHAAFVAPQVLRWRPPSSYSATYAVAPDGDRGVVLAIADHGIVPNAVRVQRYVDLQRGGSAAAPVPALDILALLLCVAGVVMFARRRLA